jgi:hypothetical protein
MSEVDELTPFERQLCRGFLTLAGIGIAVLLLHWQLVAMVCAEFISLSTRKTLPALAAGRMPDFDRMEFIFGCLVGGLLGAIFLMSQYLAYLVGCGRLLRPSTLWFCTMVFGGLNALLVCSVLPVIAAPAFGIVLIVTAGVCLYFGRKAWKARR